MNNYLISYDISKDSLRTRIGDKIIAYGLDRIQYSVYLGAMTEANKQTLLLWMQQEIMQKGNSQSDTIILIPLTATQIKAATIIGKNNYDLDFLSGQNNSLLL
jgi:CRISPR-associated endonuclease Cas2